VSTDCCTSKAGNGMETHVGVKDEDEMERFCGEGWGWK